MPSRTVSLESSAYERLKAAKREGESFSKLVNRILADSRPSFRSLAGFLSPREAVEVRRAVRAMRKSELPAETSRLKRWRSDRDGAHR